MDNVKTVMDFYDSGVETEWERLGRHVIEFEITKRFLSRYIQPGDKVLDMGGGPGRYSLWLAERGCDVTLADLSAGNAAFALEKAKERGLPLRAVQADARDPYTLKGEGFDHILLFGPLYHLLEESDREKSVNACLEMLRPGGTLSCAFISLYAGIIYYMKDAPELIIQSYDLDKEFMECFIGDKSYSGPAFTQANFTRKDDALEFISRFPLEKLHFLSQEAMLAPCEHIIMAQPPEIVGAWINLAEKVCEREDLLSYAEHFLFIGRKTS